MILTCPRCATRYLVEDGDLRDDGRKVRCSACGENWRAFPDGRTEPLDTPPLAAPEADIVEPAAAETDSPAEADQTVVVADADQGVAAPVVDVPVGQETVLETSGEPLTQTVVETPGEPTAEPAMSMVSPIPHTRRRRSSPAGTVIALLVIVILAAVALVVLRDDVVRAWPAARSVYTSVGLHPLPVARRHG